MKTTGKNTFKQEKMEGNVKNEMFPLGLIFVIMLIGYYAPASIFYQHEHNVQRKAASGDIR